MPLEKSVVVPFRKSNGTTTEKSLDFSPTSDKNVNRLSGGCSSTWPPPPKRRCVGALLLIRWSYFEVDCRLSLCLAQTLRPLHGPWLRLFFDCCQRALVGYGPIALKDIPGLVRLARVQYQGLRDQTEAAMLNHKMVATIGDERWDALFNFLLFGK